MKKIKTLLLLSFFLFSCGQENKEQQMEEFIQQRLSLTHTYDHRPIYGAQVNKSGSKLIIEVEGSTDYRFTENRGESMMLPLNLLLLNSGKKNVIIKVYPRDGEEYLTKYANVSITFYRAEDKDTSLKEYQQIAKFTLPNDLEEKKLPFYEAKITIDTDVPFTYDQELAKAKDLKNIPHIEQMIVEKYNQIRKLCINLDQISYLQELIHTTGHFSNVLYNNSYNEIKKSTENTMAVVDDDPRVLHREFLPIENYEIQY